MIVNSFPLEYYPIGFWKMLSLIRNSEEWSCTHDSIRQTIQTIQSTYKRSVIYVQKEYDSISKKAERNRRTRNHISDYYKSKYDECNYDYECDYWESREAHDCFDHDREQEELDDELYESSCRLFTCEHIVESVEIFGPPFLQDFDKQVLKKWIQYLKKVPKNEDPDQNIRDVTQQLQKIRDLLTPC